MRYNWQSIPGFADGNLTGKPAIVGEALQIFVPDSAGTVISNKDIGTQLLRSGVNAALKPIELPFFADGGRPEVGKPAIVGEKGPEIFIPDSAGTVISNDEAFNDARSALVSTSGRPATADEESEAFNDEAFNDARSALVIQAGTPL